MRQGYFKAICLVCISGLVLFTFIIAALAQETKEEEITVEVKQVKGEVSSFSPGNNPRYIGITYKEDKESSTAYEMVLSIDEDVILKHKRQLSEIGLGDTVDVVYEQRFKTTEQGEKRIISRIAKIIIFIRPADEQILRKYGLIEDQWEE
jgi:hypothetical protein